MKTLVEVVVLLGLILFVFPSAKAETGGSAAAPGIVTLDSLVKEYKPVRFDHEKHTAIAGDCGKCHHQHGNNSSLPCQECHAIKAQSFKSSVKGNFMACKNCHGAYDPATPAMPGLKTSYHRQCFQCHWGMGEVGASPKGCTVMCHDKRDQKTSAKADKTR